MPSSKRSTGASSKGTSVDTYMAKLDHPYRMGVETLRKAILALDPDIHEEIKWNAPSFRLEDHFATFRLHPQPIFQLVLHTGARSKNPKKSFHLDDPDNLVKWADKDRCSLAFTSDADAMARMEEVQRIVRAWMQQL